MFGTPYPPKANIFVSYTLNVNAETIKLLRYDLCSGLLKPLIECLRFIDIYTHQSMPFLLWITGFANGTIRHRTVTLRKLSVPSLKYIFTIRKFFICKSLINLLFILEATIE